MGLLLSSFYSEVHSTSLFLNSLVPAHSKQMERQTNLKVKLEEKRVGYKDNVFGRCNLDLILELTKMLTSEVLIDPRVPIIIFYVKS